MSPFKKAIAPFTPIAEAEHLCDELEAIPLPGVVVVLLPMDHLVLVVLLQGEVVLHILVLVLQLEIKFRTLSLK